MNIKKSNAGFTQYHFNILKGFKKSGAGFTLVELIVAVTIVSLMAGAAVAVLNPFEQFKKAADARIKSDLSQTQKALETYYGDNGKYPTNTVDYQITGAAWGSTWGSYMNLVPKDATSGHNYVYYVINNGQTYYLYANLLREGKDPQACFSNGNECSHVPAANACGAKCNYGVSSPNTTP